MKFTDIEISGFGVWSGLEIESLSPQLTVLCGANEAGKTTILQSIRGALYGFSPARRDRYLPPVHAGQAGSTLRVQIDRQSHTITRLDDGSRLLGGVTVTGPDGSTQGESQLAELLGGIDETIYSNVFSIGLGELQELATLDETEAAAWLYDLSTGLDRVSISDVLRELRNSRTRLLSTGGDQSQLTDLLTQRGLLQSEIEELAGLNDRFWGLSADRGAADDTIRAAETLVATLTREIELLDAALTVREPWRERVLLDERMATYGHLSDLPADALRRLEILNAGIRKARRRRTQIKRRQRALRDALKQIKVNEPLWRQAARIAALSEHEPWIAALDDQLRAAQQKVAEQENQLAEARAKCGLPENAPAATSALSNRALVALRGLVKQLHATRAQLKAARDECQSLRETRRTRRAEVETALSSRGQKSLAAALEQQGQLVAQYRRRLQLDDRLDQMAMHRQELDEKHRQLIDRQVLPLWLLIAVAAVFVFGAGLVLAGLIIPWGIGATITGALIAAAAAGGKFGLERSFAHRLDATKRQLQMLQGQLHQAKAERSELDQQLPPGGGALASRLQAAEAELASLEDLLSIDARRQAADTEAGAADQRLKSAAEEWNKVRRRWQQALIEIGLPAELSPVQVKLMIAQGGSLQSLERQVAQAREERDRCRREQSAVAMRIEQLAADAPWENPGPDSPPVSLVEQLRRLRRELAVQEELVESRRNLDEEFQRLRRRFAKHGRRARRQARRRRDLFRAAGALDENDFRRRAGQRAELDELLHRRAALSEHIQTALVGHASENDAAELLALPPGELEGRRDEIVARRQAAADEIKLTAEERGRMAHQQELLADDRRLAEKHLELAVIEQRLAEAAARWRTLATTESLIESVKEDYERNRQPEVLEEASGYLERMTEGRYRRVWTPLGARSLRVDDGPNHSLPIELLSTGAREQLFLCLRLALAARYARQEKSMPLVLDDVLVNFDARRAAAAAAVFADFAAAGHQLILFTCHEHIAELFRSLQADVRVLPSNADGSRKVVSPDHSGRDTAPEPPRRRREKRPKHPQPDSDIDRSRPTSEPTPAHEIDGPLSVLSSEEVSTISVQPQTTEKITSPPATDSVEARDRSLSIQPPATTSPAPTHLRADPPHRVAPVRTRRPNSWSAEEFEGELEDRVNAAASTQLVAASQSAVPPVAGQVRRVADSPSANGDTSGAST